MTGILSHLSEALLMTEPIWQQLQLSLAHSMGLDQNMRAENTVDAVSTLRKGQKIDGYAMINMSAIQVVNDMVGGVTVTIEGDFSERDKRKLQLTMEKPSIRY